MDAPTINVCITGATGQIAYSFINLLGAGKVFSLDQPINLRLLGSGSEDSLPKLRGLQLEIEDCAFPVIRSIAYGNDPLEMFANADWVVFIGGYPRKQGMERKDLLLTNNKIFKEQGKALDKVARKTCKSVVVANPANTNCLTLLKNAPSIPPQNFSCLTRLDHNRALAQLANKAGVGIESVRNVVIWGNHSATQFPDFFQAEINGKSVQEVIQDDDYLKKEFIKRVARRGTEIMEARKQSSVMSGASAVKDHIRSIAQGTEDGEWVSMGVYSRHNKYGIDNDLIFSFPVTINKDTQEWSFVDDIKLNEFQQSKINDSMKELQEEKAQAFSIVFKEPITLCIAGASDQVGLQLLQTIAAGEVLGIDQPLKLRLLDVEQSAPALSAIKEQMEGSGYTLLRSVEIGHDPEEFFKDVNVLIFLNEFTRKQGLTNYKEILQKNNQIYSEYGKTLNKAASSQKCKVVVAANPVNINCLTIANNCPSIPKKNFASIPKFEYQLTRNVNNGTGELSQKKRQDAVQDQQRKQMLSPVRTPMKTAAQSIKDLLRSWCFGTKEGESITMGVFSGGNQFGIDSDLVFNFPVTCKNFEWEFTSKVSINEDEQRKIKAVQKQLKDEIMESLF